MDETLELLAALSPPLTDGLITPYLRALQAQYRASTGSPPPAIPKLLAWAEARTGVGDIDAPTRAYWHAWHALILARSEMELLR